MRWGPWTQSVAALLLASEGSVGLFQTREYPEGVIARTYEPPEAAESLDAAWSPTEVPALGELPGLARRSRIRQHLSRNGTTRPHRVRRRRKSKLAGVCDVILDSDAHGSPVCGPQVIIGGAMKCGTNSLGSMLALHPRVKLHLCREQECQQCGEKDCMEQYQGSSWSGSQVLWESHYFTYMTSNHQPPRDYQGNEGRHVLARLLPRTNGRDNITLDKSPSYLDTEIFPDVVSHAKRLLPNAKVIFSFCDPALRLYAEYYHSMKWSNETLLGYFQGAGATPPHNFSDWVGALQDDSSFCREHNEYCKAAQNAFLSKGIYVDSLQRWLDAFGRDKVLVMDLVEGEEKLQQQVARLLAHVGLPFEEYPWTALKSFGSSFVNHDYNGRGYALQEAPEAMNTLRKYYKSHNKRLADVLREYWPLDW